MTLRREFLKKAAAAAAAAIPSGAAQAAAESYQLGCQTLPYRAYPLARAFEGIRKAGFKNVMFYHQCGGKVVFGPDLSSEERASLRRQLSDAGLVPFMSYAGLMKEIARPGGLDNYLKELDLCKEFGIGTVVSIGPWYYTKWPNLPKRDRDFQKEADAFFAAMERGVRHAESLGITITLKPHTGLCGTAKACMQVLKRLPSDRLKICWDAGNVSFYEGIYPDPDLPDLAPDVKAVCLKDHLGGRAEANFPPPGQGQIDHPLMFKILFGAGFHGPLAVERVDGKDNAAKMPAELIDERLTATRNYLVPVLEQAARG